MGSATAIVDSTTDLQGSRGSCGRYCDDTAWKTEAARNSALAVTEIIVCCSLMRHERLGHHDLR